ncbi:hypothetical protein Tco_0630532, partial [Tanacetum coccineum]
MLVVKRSGLIYCSGGLSGKYTVLAVCQIVHCASGLSFLTAVCLIRQRFLKTFSHSDLGNKPLPISFLGSGLVSYIHSGLPTFLSSGLELIAVDTVVVYRFLKIISHSDLGIKALPISFLGSGLVFLLHSANLSEDIQCASSNTRPPMLDRTNFASWQQCIRMYCWGKENRVNILKSIDEGPFQMGTFRETLAEGNEDIRATNILLQGLPKDIYTLINHYTDVKDIWDNVKMLLEGSELTKEDHESQLYDDFEHFRQNKGETIYDYYVRFTKLINDMRNIKMTMPRMQLNSKFVNNMLPEWGRFVTAVKLNGGLRDSNYDQMYAYLKQYEAHANENKMMLERFTQPNFDPLALMSNVSHQQYYSQSSTTPPSTHVQLHFVDNAQLDSCLSPMDNLIENLTNTLALLSQSYKTYLPQTNNQLRTSSNTRNQAIVQDGMVVVQNVQGRQNRGQGNNARGTGAAGYGGAQNRVGNENPGQARQ